MVEINEMRREFERNVWDHSIDPFQMQFDDRRELSGVELSLLETVFHLAVDEDNDEPEIELGRLLEQHSDLLRVLLQLCGLTRNKILQDLKASEAAVRLGITIPSSFDRLPFTPAWRLAGPYLIRRLKAVFSHLDPERPSLKQVFEALNQSTWPGYIRQERAKRSGHEAEYRLATLFFSLGIDFDPVEKSENPLCRDAQIDGISFDLVVPNTSNPMLVVKATVHTANIGQYGESKDHLEMDEARRWIDSTYPTGDHPTLLAFIDGVGFRSNSDGLNGVLQKSDEFCQFQTIWKAVVVSASATGKPLKIALAEKDIDEFKDFLERWQYLPFVVDRSTLDDSIGWIEAGRSLIHPPT